MIEFLEYDDYIKELEAVKKKNEYVVCEIIYGSLFEEERTVDGIKYKLQGIKSKWQKKVYKLEINGKSVGFNRLVEFLTTVDEIDLIPTIIEEKAKLSRNIKKKWNTFVALSREDDGVKDKIYAVVDKEYNDNELPDFMESLIEQALDVDNTLDPAELSIAILTYCVSENLIKKQHQVKYYNQIIEEASEYAKSLQGDKV